MMFRRIAVLAWAETFVLRQASDVEALDILAQIARDQQRTP